MKLNLIIVFFVFFSPSLFAQTTLYAKPTKRFQSPLLGGGALGWLEPSKKYKVIGFDTEDNALLQHEGGIVKCRDKNFLKYRILDGGLFSEFAPITVSKPSSVIDPPLTNGNIFATYEAELSALIPKLYVAFQIYVDGEPYAAAAKSVTNKRLSVTLELVDVPSNAKILSDVRYYINGKEISTVTASENLKPYNNLKW